MSDASEGKPLGEWLSELASGTPAPGGGAAAAMSASMAAGLICMVCNLTIGKPRYAAHEPLMKVALERGEAARRRALELADEDAAAFNRAIEAYRLPRATDSERSRRSAAIQAATVASARVPLLTAALSAEVISLSAMILEGANANLISDVAIAAQLGRAALDASVMNVEVNLASIEDQTVRQEIAGALARSVAALDEVAPVVEAVRRRLAR